MGKVEEKAMLKMMQPGWLSSFGQDMSQMPAPSTLATPCAKRKASVLSDVVLPSGPRDPPGLQNWVEHIYNQLCNIVGRDVVAKRLVDYMKKGVYITSHYSGMGTAEEALSFGLTRLADTQPELAAMSTGVGLQCCSSCDKSSTCRKVCGPASKHVLGDILRLLPAHTRDRLETKLVSVQRKLAEGFESAPQGRTVVEKTRLVAALGKQWLEYACDILEEVQFSENMMDLCYACKKNCLCFPPKKKIRDGLHFELAGSTRVAFSTMSQKGLRWLDASSLPFLVWCHVMKKTRPPPHAIAHACVMGFEPTLFQNRRRRYTLCHFLGNSTVDSGIARSFPYDFETFGSCAFRTLETDARVYFDATAEEQEALLEAMAAAVHLPAVWNRGRIAWSSVRKNGDYTRLLRWAAHAKEVHGQSAALFFLAFQRCSESRLWQDEQHSKCFAPDNGIVRVWRYHKLLAAAHSRRIRGRAGLPCPHARAVAFVAACGSAFGRWRPHPTSGHHAGWQLHAVCSCRQCRSVFARHNRACRSKLVG